MKKKHQTIPRYHKNWTEKIHRKLLNIATIHDGMVSLRCIHMLLCVCVKNSSHTHIRSEELVSNFHLQRIETGHFSSWMLSLFWLLRSHSLRFYVEWPFIELEMQAICLQRENHSNEMCLWNGTLWIVSI